MAKAGATYWLLAAVPDFTAAAWRLEELQ